jgi:hypothetical protein
LTQEDYVNKVTFVYVIEEEHKRLGFSYAKPFWQLFTLIFDNLKLSK